MDTKENCINLHNGKFIARIKFYKGSDRIDLIEQRFDRKTSIAEVFKWCKESMVDNVYLPDSIKISIFTLSGYRIYKERLVKFENRWLTLNELFSVV